MSSSNINDPGAIQALLDQLRSSEAWQNAVSANATATASQVSQPPLANTAPATQDTNSTTYSGAPNAPNAPHPSPRGLEPQAALGAQSGGSSTANSVASLLSQLQTSSTLAAAVAGPSRLSTPAMARPRQPPRPPQPPAGSSGFPGPDAAALPSSMDTDTGPVALTSTPAARQDVRACTFQQALPHLARLSADGAFLKALAAMRTEQADLERQLWRERREIQRRHEGKVETARTKANIIGAGLTPYEAEVLTDSFRAELLRFDRDRVLPAWDGLLAKQQAALESLGVPAMFPTSQATDRERQQEIMQVLGRLVNTENTRSLGGGDG